MRTAQWCRRMGERFAVLADPRPKDTLASVHTVVEKRRRAPLRHRRSTGPRARGGVPASTTLPKSPGRQTAISWPSRVGLPRSGITRSALTIDLCSQDGVKRIADLAAPTSGLAWTDRGRTLVFASTTTQVVTPDHVWTVSVNGGQPADQTPHLAASAVGVKGDPRGDVWVEVHKGVVVEIDRFQMVN